MVAVLRKAFNLAIRWGWRDPPPLKWSALKYGD
jgi:hypothetical protein